MADTPQLGELLKKWEESRCRGHELSPAELCRDCPELLNTLAQQIDALRTPASKSANTITETTMAQDLADFADADARFAAADYQIIRELGRGGMGIVYEAFDKKCQRTVALKTFKKIDPTALYRFKHEFRALADVTHPNLVPLFELISDGQSWFFTMEYVQGVDFLAYLQAEDTLPPHARLRAVLRQLAEGIVALHGAGKLHRDIKPSNVLVTRAGRVVLLDFGLAADIEYQSFAQQIVGTAAYMAPEQALGLPATPACDWYSVGVMLFEALTGRRPHVGGRRQTLMEKQFIDPPPPRSLVPDIPDDLNALCIDLLSRQADKRPTGPEIIRRLRLEGIGAEKPAPRLPVPAPRLAFVGRQQHLATLRDAFQATRTGKAVTMYVQGRSGLGKSALVQRFLAGLQEHDEAMVLAGRCYERESVPYKAIDSLIDSLSQYLGRLPPRPGNPPYCRRDILARHWRVFPCFGTSPPLRKRRLGRSTRPTDRSCVAGRSRRCASMTQLRLPRSSAAGAVHRRPAVGRPGQRIAVVRSAATSRPAGAAVRRLLPQTRIRPPAPCCACCLSLRRGRHPHSTGAASRRQLDSRCPEARRGSP